MIAASPAVLDKAAALAVRYEGRGRFAVASGSTPGLVYEVQAPAGNRDPLAWACSCEWAARGGFGCAHARAAGAWLARWYARQERAAARAARRGAA